MDTKDELLRVNIRRILVDYHRRNDYPLNKAEDDMIALIEEQESKECDHPFAFVQSRCFGEINHCLKCGKDL